LSQMKMLRNACAPLNSRIVPGVQPTQRVALAKPPRGKELRVPIERPPKNEVYP
jgi:hypothetical protein